MLSRVNSMVWMDNNKPDEENTPWPQTNNNNNNNMLENNMDINNNNNNNNKDQEMEMGGALSTFKSILDVAAEDQDWYTNTNNNNNNINNNEISFSPSFTDHSNLLLDSSASCSPSPAASVFNNLDPNQIQFFLPPKTTPMPMLLNPMSSSNLGDSFDLGTCDLAAFSRGSGVVFNGGLNDVLNGSNFGSGHQFGGGGLLPLQQSNGLFGGNGGNDSSLFFNRSKTLKPLENFTSIGAQPTLFQKRAALRKNLASNNGGNLGSLGGENLQGLNNGEIERKRKSLSGDDFEDVSIDGSTLNYDSDDFMDTINGDGSGKGEESGKNGGGGVSSNANSGVTGGGGDPKGKKKGLPAKNLMAERRRRKKLNDRLYMLRSVVPKISKMDRASILGDAIEYLKELLQKINDLHNELESTPPGSSLTPTGSFYPLTPTATALPSRIKEELCPSAFASPLSSPTGQPARVEVRVREGRAVNIHMFCNRKPGILLSTMRALDNLGLDIQQAVISCFNGFALDVFRAEQCKEGQEIHPEHIKALLLESAGYHGMV